jgi:hypothetical protein
MVPPVIDTGWHNNRQPNLRVAKQQISPRIGRNGGTTAGAKEERGRGWVPGGWDARRRRRRWSGGEASPALVERWRWKLWVAEGRGDSRSSKQTSSERGGPTGSREGKRQPPVGPAAGGRPTGPDEGPPSYPLSRGRNVAKSIRLIGGQKNRKKSKNREKNIITI